jgi:L-lactate permease
MKKGNIIALIIISIIVFGSIIILNVQNVESGIFKVLGSVIVTSSCLRGKKNGYKN